MPLPKRFTVTGSSGLSNVLIPDYGCDPFNIGIGCVAGSTGVTFSVQHTFDPIMSNTQIPGVSVVAASAATWHNHITITGVSCSMDGNYAFPVLGIRVVTSSNSSATSNVKVTLVQAGP